MVEVFCFSISCDCFLLGCLFLLQKYYLEVTQIKMQLVLLNLAPEKRNIGNLQVLHFNRAYNFNFLFSGNWLDFHYITFFYAFTKQYS